MKTVTQVFWWIPKYLFSLLAVILLPSLAQADGSTYPLIKSTKNAGLIFSGRKDYAKYDLLVGKMEYVEDVNSEGFKPADKRELIGSIDRRLYDYQKQKSAIQIYEGSLASLKRQNFRIVYQCSGEICGGAAGWRLFLSDKLGGDSRFQHYVVVTKDLAFGGSQYVVLYVNDLAGQPRALVDVVTIPSPARRDTAESDEVEKKSRKGGVNKNHSVKTSIYFDLGQSVLVDRAEQLSRAKQFVESHRSECPIQVIGYTDALGGESSNQNLAKARVAAVIDYLGDIKEMTPNCLVPDPRGIEAAASNGERKESRRVDLELAVRN